MEHDVIEEDYETGHLHGCMSLYSSGYLPCDCNVRAAEAVGVNFYADCYGEER